MKNVSMTIVLLLSGLIALTSCDGELEIEQSINEQFAGISQIEVDGRFLEVRYEGDPNLTSVELDGLLKSTRSGAYQIKVDHEGSLLKIELDQVGKFGAGNHLGHIYLKGPQEMNLNLVNGSGSVRVFKVISPALELETGSGTIEMHLNQIQKTRINVGSGDVGVFNHQGEVQADSGSGRIEMQGTRGAASLKSSSGAIHVRSMEGLLEAEVSSGNVELENVSSLGKIKASSGNITGESVGLSPTSNFVSSSGSIFIRTFSNLQDFNFDLLTNSGNVKVGNNSANGALKIFNGSAHTVLGRVSSGQIEIVN